MSLAKEGGLECRTVVLGGALGGGGCSELSELANTATVNATVWGYVGTDKNALCYEAVHRRSYFRGPEAFCQIQLGFGGCRYVHMELRDELLCWGKFREGCTDGGAHLRFGKLQ